MPSVVLCGKCHESNPPNATTCQRCGARLCPNCHQVIESPNSSVCPHCGKKDFSFKPGKYGTGTYAAAGLPAAEIGAGRSICQSCGNKIDPGMKKCPYCGQLGQRFTISPQQGHGVMRPGPTEVPYSSPAPVAAESGPSLQRVCPKCGMPFPPGSSQCPKHGKYGGTGILGESGPPLPGRFTGDLWRRIEEKRAASASPEPVRQRHTAPEEIYPQMAYETGAPPMETAAPQRVCPSCRSPVPDRSKVCPTCGWNRLPPEKTRPIPKAEEYYKSRAASAEPYAAYSQPVDQYYAQPAAGAYEAAYPPFPTPVQQPYEEKEQRKEKRPREVKEGQQRPGERKSPLPLLFALLALTGVIILAVVFLMDQLKPRQAVVVPPPTTTGTATAKAPVISGIQFSNITKDSAVVTWKTDKKSNSIVIYCLNGGTQCENAKDDNLVTDHSVKLTGLKTGSAYHITVQYNSPDVSNAADASKEATDDLKTAGAVDTTPPKISEVKVSNITTSSTYASAEITWKTDEPATSQVSYGTSVGYGTLQPDQPDPTLDTFHDITLNGLPAQSTINFKVLSKDAAGNAASSSNATFTTPTKVGFNKGDTAPDFTLPCGNCADGNPIALSSLRGKKVLINFWSLNCGYCQEEMPYLQQVHEKYPNIPLLAICGPYVSPVNRVQVGSITSSYTYSVLLDDSGSVGQQYNVTSGAPVSFLLDSNGIIKNFQNGAFMGGASQIESFLNTN